MTLFRRTAFALFASACSHAALAADTPFAAPGLQMLKPMLGVTFAYVDEDLKPADGKYACGPTTRIMAESAAVQVGRALALIQPAISSQRLRTVVLCNGASKDGKPAGGVAVPSQDLLVLGIADPSATQPDELIQAVTLHEFFHLSEYRLGGTGDSNWDDRFTGYDLEERSWRGTGIGGGGRNFLNPYSHSYAREERAELFAALVLNAHEVSNYVDINNDEILRKKAEYVADRASRTLGLSLSVQ